MFDVIVDPLGIGVRKTLLDAAAAPFFGLFFTLSRPRPRRAIRRVHQALLSIRTDDLAQVPTQAPSARAQIRIDLEHLPAFHDAHLSMPTVMA